MALTWQGAAPESLPHPLDQRKAEGPVHYRLHRVGSHLLWSAQLPGHFPLEVPVELVVGGRRHGRSFLARVTEIEGEKLQYAPLVETRFLESAHETELVLSPGFPSEQPVSYETAIGRVLGPSLEKKCLTCHGLAAEHGTTEQGVRCESCHGPGEAHLKAVMHGNSQSGIVNPDKLTVDESLALCGRCHSGFGNPAAPMPDELLISSQVVALRNTECFMQSGKGLTCTTCHDPHHDANENGAVYNTACRKCHGLQAPEHAGICPVNQDNGCVGCHMPKQSKGAFQMVDHWIRVHPEQPAPPHERIPAFRSRITPTAEFLRLICVTDEAQANDIRRQLEAGTSFSDVAVKYSTDPSAENGGYLGQVQLNDLIPTLAAAAAKLKHGEISPVLSTSGKFLILARMPRDFRYTAVELEKEADALRAKGQLRQAVDKYLEALRMYPTFLRALSFMGAAEQQLGNVAQATKVLEYAARLYPDDAAAQFNLGVAYNSMGDAESAIAAYRRAIYLEPEFFPVYFNLGTVLFSVNRMSEAIRTFSDGLRVDPISAPLYYGLGMAEQRLGNAAGAKHALALAQKIDPEFVRRQWAK
jgi:tetratricopeptide (TPR) repeat protein